MKDLPPMSPDPAASELGSKRDRIFRKAMTKWPQFSLAYLFLEIFWIALALGLMMQAVRLRGDAASRFSVALLLLSAQAWGAAVGGLFHRMRTGFFFVSAVIIGVILLLFLLTDGSIMQLL